MIDNGSDPSPNLIDNTNGADSSSNNLQIDNRNSEREVGNQQPNSSDERSNQQAETFFDVIRFEFPKFSRLRESDIEQFLLNHIGEENFEDLKMERFPSQWIVRIKTKEIRERLLRIWKTKIRRKTCWIKPYYDYELRGFIHWLPHFISDEDVRTQLCQFGEVLVLENEVHDYWDEEIKSEVRYFGLLLKIGMVKNDLPHFLKIKGYRALVIVRGRQPACFHCREFGHSKKDCRKYVEKLNQYCKKTPPGKPRTKPRGCRHRPDIIDEHDSEDKLQNETNSNSITTIPFEVEAASKHTHFDWKSADYQEKTEILAVFQSLEKWGTETVEMARQTLKNIEDNIKLSLTSSEMTESEANEESIEFRIKVIELLADMEKNAIEMIKQTLNSSKNTMAEHFGLDSTATLENLISDLEKCKEQNIEINEDLEEELLSLF